MWFSWDGEKFVRHASEAAAREEARRATQSYEVDLRYYGVLPPEAAEVCWGRICSTNDRAGDE
jgi:hypothetical protein